jgi:fido (protein-threonine AMPylation protein)
MESYERQTEPGKAERSYNWKTAIGLQAVDGLKPSQYLIDMANANINGEITLDDVERAITEYYDNKPDTVDDRTDEADKVSARIAEVLSSRTFNLSPVELLSIHRRLFDGIYDFAGKIRDYNISKSEWVLGGASVYYGDFHDIRELLDYDFERERNFDYGRLDSKILFRHIAKFIADVWQIHAFGEGNTRTIAVFAIKYLRAFGYDVDNDTFEKNSYYFRNALVRANYNDYKNDVKATPEFLNRFFGNLLLGETHTLKSRDLLVTTVVNI